MLKLAIRARSGSVQRRAGLVLAPLGHWVLDHITRDVEGARRLLALVETPGITVQYGDPRSEETGVWLNDYDWSPAITLDEARAIFEHVQAAESDDDLDDDEVAELIDGFVTAANATNTHLPTAEPTLERDACEMTPQAKTPEKPADQGKAAEEVTPPPPPVVNDTSSSTPAPEVQAPVAVEESAATAKPETKPAPKAPKPKA